MIIKKNTERNATFQVLVDTPSMGESVLFTADEKWKLSAASSHTFIL